mmetsp:Transcript_1227/g.4821  ORF Transcript_1227/g.4821 Transcript_1227/m.4821 type:complete len:232 (-) Transcript_1227:180-875(-)
MSHDPWIKGTDVGRLDARSLWSRSAVTSRLLPRGHVRSVTTAQQCPRRNAGSSTSRSAPCSWSVPTGSFGARFVRTTCTSPYLLEIIRCLPSSSYASAVGFLRSRHRRTHSYASPAGVRAKSRTALSSAAVARNLPVGSNAIARMASACQSPSGSRGARISGDAGVCATPSPMLGTFAAARSGIWAPVDASKTATPLPYATAMCAPLGCIAMRGAGAWFMCSPPHDSPGPS